jgi:uncharacterized repeat protein (TIGR01451 family)
VAGLAALVRSLHPALSPLQVSQVITSTASDVQSPGWDPTSGWGRIDAEAALVRLGQHGLVLSTEVSPGSFEPGTLVTYTISFGQNDEAMAGIVVSDTLPTGIDFVSASPAGTYRAESHQVVWGPLILAKDAQITATVSARVGAAVPSCASMTNTVHLFYDPDEQPLVVTDSHRLLPCYAHLPVMRRDR